VKPSVNWLLALIPVTLALEHGGAPAPWVFFIAAVAILPVARLIVRSTEELAAYTGDAVGALLNPTFGNAPELIIALVALRAGLLDMVRASIVGAILANLLLALGIAFLAGGVRFHTQTYREAAARMYGSVSRSRSSSRRCWCSRATSWRRARWSSPSAGRRSDRSSWPSVLIGATWRATGAPTGSRECSS
jgi:hypothetical protein